MTTLSWMAAIFGLSLGVLLVGIVFYDITAVQTGRPTISAVALQVGRAYPVVPALLGLILGLLLGILLGHLWLKTQIGLRP